MLTASIVTIRIGDPAYIAKLIPALVTVSMRTLELTRALPEFTIESEWL